MPSRSFHVVRIGNELVDARGGNTHLGSTGTAQAVALGDQTIRLASGGVVTPSGGHKVVARLGSGATLEWISYDGTEVEGDGTVKLTGVQRGLFESEPRTHALGTSLIVPSQIAGCTRGAFETEPAAIAVDTPVVPVAVLTNCQRGVANTEPEAHAQGASIRVFGDDDGIRMTAVHEIGHAIGMGPHRPNTIMWEEIGRGAYLGNGVFDVFADASNDEIDAR